MSYTIEFTQKAEKQFFDLEKEVQVRISKALDRITIRPESFLERLTDSKYYKFRVGDYRLIMDMQREKLILMIIKVGHRKNVYD